MGTIVWIAFVACFAAWMLRNTARRWLAGQLRRRTRDWPLRVRSDGSLRVGFKRARLYGLASFDAAAADCLREALTSTPLRWRAVAMDRDGTLALVVRCGGDNPALGLLRMGLARTRGTGARRYRRAQAQAQRDGAGIWRLGVVADRREAARTDTPAVLVFPWWQG